MLKILFSLMIANILFFPSGNLWRTPDDLGLPYEEIKITTADNIQLYGWFLPTKQSRHTLLFLHGNAGNIADRLDKAKSWLTQNISVLLIDYRGFGKSEGKITGEPGLNLDAKAGYDWLIQKNIASEKILIYGESVGAGPALNLATSVRSEGVILEGAFSSLKDMAKLHYFPVPDFLLGDFKFDNRQKIKDLKVPVFFIHGSLDEICPISMAKELYELAKTRKSFYEIHGASHNDTYAGEPKEMYEEALTFFEK